MNKLSKEEQDKKKLLWFLWLHDYFQRYYKQEASEKETRVITNWFPEELTDTSFKVSDSQIKKGIDKVWETLSAQYGFVKPEQEPVKIFRLQKLFYYAAAILVLAMGSLTAYQYNRYDTLQSLESLFADTMKFHTGNSDVKSFTLPDGSVISLNGNTTITLIKDEFNKAQREVWLEDGEVFFDVAKNPAKRFIIHSRDADVIVRGTSFSVTAYKTLNKSSVAVRTGKVEVITNNKKLNTLYPAQTLVINKKEARVSISEIKTSGIAAWKDGSLNFNRSDTDELVLRMEQHFDVKVNVQPGLIKNVDFSASFDKNAQIQDVLQVIADIYSVQYSITNNTVTLHK